MQQSTQWQTWRQRYTTLGMFTLKLTGCFGDEFITVSGADSEETISKVKVKPRLSRYLAYHLQPTRRIDRSITVTYGITLTSVVVFVGLCFLTIYI